MACDSAAYAYGVDVEADDIASLSQSSDPALPASWEEMRASEECRGGGEGGSLVLGTHNGNYGGRYAQVTCLPSSRVYQVQTTAIYFYLLVEVRDSAGVGRSVRLTV